jgi:wobble nucleotide-excising tRNase
MLTRIDKLYKWGIFNELKWNSTLPDFRKFNIFYGWNGTGKTTLTSLFRCLETGEIETSFLESEFQFDKSGQKIDNKNFAELRPSIRVFNRDFLEHNISWKDGEVHPILGVGADSIELNKKIDLDENLLTAKQNAVSATLIEHSKTSATLEALLRKNATAVKEAIGFKSPDGFYDKYDAKKLRPALDSFANENSFKLSDADRIVKEQILSGKLKQKCDFYFSYEAISFPKVEVDQPSADKDDISKANALLRVSIKNTMIQRFKDSVEFNQWAKVGRDLHKNHSKTEQCQFCGNQFAPQFWNELGSHFSQDYDNFIASCDRTSAYLSERKISVVFPQSNAFYDDLIPTFLEAKRVAELAMNALNNFIEDAIGKIEQKKSNPLDTKLVTIDGSMLSELYAAFDSSHQAVHDVVKLANERTANFALLLADAKKTIELHLLSGFHQEYIELKSKVSQLAIERDSLTVEIGLLQNRIVESKKQISDYGIKLDEFNSMLVSFMGRNEIKLTLGDKPDRATYRIQRYAEDATRLSEGERTAIGFIYFITKLTEANFDIKSSIVVIDDPVSSLDSNFLFNAFSFMKRAVCDAKQIFIFTHNFNFLRLLTRWLDNKKDDLKNKILLSEGRTPKEYRASFYMLRAEIKNSAKRAAMIEKLDVFLLNYQTEYEFIYKELKRFTKDAPSNLEEFYNVPNLARKLLETFMSFKCPGKLELKDRMDREKGFDQATIDKLFEFVNFHSHAGLDRGESIDLSFLAETPQVITQMFNFMKHVDRGHIERMDEMVG